MADNSVISFADRGDMRAFANSYIPETEIMQRARQRGSEIGTYDTTPAVGSLLRYLAHLIGATSVVEVGTGAGVSGLWILPSLSTKGLLTSIDDEVENAKLAKQAFEEAGFSPSRFRLITGNSREIVGKLADSLYDIFILRHSEDLLESVENAHRSLRPGGILIIDQALLGGKVADPTQRDPESISRREVIKVIKESSDEWLPMLLPVGDGVLAATKL
ncbi:MAG: methyltransferase domain-containing protein [Actinobacteria bacterium]|jgi:predicted O-methyltransferase YrrM|nr:methyltransferase domain-containing protein [Actinomycetota bacterium]NCW34598.1 methyltransferase domain-containing protein [Actinomycetota bacterium]NDC12729.1 methyltransferase domain-containing protein [Actinomycetota bacterium]NDC51619.1 methyltransferase domain-containing protein [Actinomycetota bacterium]NDD60010.1 methyltransferase domain-containing protein [Actinomycetota bacterium]